MYDTMVAYESGLYIKNKKDIEDWIKNLNPIEDGEKISKLQSISDRMTKDFLQYLKEETA